jgi:ketosteroid isomerase-like protein
MKKSLPILCLLLLATTAFAQSSAVDSLVAAERAFAKKSHDTNIREAFLANVTDQAVIFNPGPQNAKQVYQKQPPTPNPPPVTLDWAPAYAEVANSGTIGFTTGPYTLTDNKTRSVKGHGTFFSVWEKQNTGEWKVALDFGVSSSKVQDLTAVKLKTGAPSAYREKVKRSGAEEMTNLAGAETLLSMGKPEDRSANYRDALAPNAFVVEDGLTQLTGAADREKHLARMKKVDKWTLNGGSISGTHDLAYTFGSYELHTGSDPKAPAKMGFFARVWKRDAQGKWKIVLDNTQAPAE